MAKLNTAEARRLIAEAADPSPELIARWRQHVHVAENLDAEAVTQSALAVWRAQAVTALAKMGDRSYLPLLEKLADDPSYDVRSAAIWALGPLGREKAIEPLARIAEHGRTASDRQDAVMSLGETTSLKAVPILIDLITSPNSGEAGASTSALLTLTHHSVPVQETPLDTQLAWRAWWNANKGSARAYGPYDCSTAQ